MLQRVKDTSPQPKRLLTETATSPVAANAIAASTSSPSACMPATTWSFYNVKGCRKEQCCAEALFCRLRAAWMAAAEPGARS